jgi:hypothetical protein
VNTLGGIEVPVACAYTDWRLKAPNLDQNNENNWWLYTVGPGEVYMDGDLALWYARSRSKSSDFDRGRRQQEVLRTLFDKALQTGTFTKIPQLYDDLSSSVITDLSLADMLRMAPYSVNFTNANIRSYYIRPPYVQGWTTPGGASVLLPQEEALQQLLIEATTLSPYAVVRENIIVEVQNGASFETLESLAASRLNYAGYQTSASIADRRDYANSVLVDFTPGQDSAQQQTILNVLGLYSANIISLPDANSPVQYPSSSAQTTRRVSDPKIYRINPVDKPPYSLNYTKRLCATRKDKSMAKTSDSAHITAKTLLPAAISGWEMFMLRSGTLPNTVKAFLSDVRLLTQFMPQTRAIGAITTDDLNRFFEWMEKGRGIPCSPKTLSRRITSVKSFFRWLHQHGTLTIDPAEKVLQRSAISPLPQVLTEEEYKPSCSPQTVTAAKNPMPAPIPWLSPADHRHQKERMSRHPHQSH